jgi:clan AA aspartic protease (TIGR02281 family)
MLSWAIKQLFLWTSIVLVASIGVSNGSKSVITEWLYQAPKTWSTTSKERDLPQYHQTMMIPASKDGHFRVTAEIDGEPVRFLIDTGATNIVLAADVADRVGLRISDRDYSGVAHTAGGLVRTASVKLGYLKIGNMTLYDLDARVVEKLQGISLLGIDFLKELDGYEVDVETLKLFW